MFNTIAVQRSWSSFGVISEQMVKLWNHAIGRARGQKWISSWNAVHATREHLQEPTLFSFEESHEAKQWLQSIERKLVFSSPPRDTLYRVAFVGSKIHYRGPIVIAHLEKDALTVWQLRTIVEGPQWAYHFWEVEWLSDQELCKTMKRFTHRLHGSTFKAKSGDTVWHS